jgi:peroxiredoxin family protein
VIFLFMEDFLQYICRKNSLIQNTDKMEKSNEVTLEQLQAQIDGLKGKIEKLENSRRDQLSIAVVSGDLDKILAAMVISIAAAAMDTQVKLFFSFWSLSALRDPKKSPKGKDFISKMFGMMLPTGTGKLKLSNMNMAGMGPKMIGYLMKKQNVMSLETMFKEAGELGIEIVICEMSMGLMGFKKEEFIDYPHLSYAGAATFVADASESAIQLFI